MRLLGLAVCVFVLSAVSLIAAALVDVNTASKKDLEALKGVGPATADKIIAGRPYNTKRDLLTKKIVSQKEYDAIKDKIVAHKATAKR
jgi:DNA uptake protein ComE-like DNA-binding protein